MLRLLGKTADADGSFKLPGAFSVGDRLIYAIGDIHGRYDLLKDLLLQIVRDRQATAPRRRPVLVFCGDYIDRGPQSAEVVEALVWLGDNVDAEIRTLKGNHEQALLDFLEIPTAGGDWIAVGGAETLRSYGVEPPQPENDEAGLIRAGRELLAKMPASHVRALENLEISYEAGDCLFVHAGIRPGVGLGEQQEADLLWIREEFLDWEGPPGDRLVVHGHSWYSAQPQLLDHRLGLDTGAYQTGVLTAARLFGSRVSFLRAEGQPGVVEVEQAPAPVRKPPPVRKSTPKRNSAPARRPRLN
jgi:serine/threonine protein phosphatase 1